MELMECLNFHLISEMRQYFNFFNKMIVIKLLCENCKNEDHPPLETFTMVIKDSAEKGYYPCAYGCLEKSKMLILSIEKDEKTR